MTNGNEKQKWMDNIIFKFIHWNMKVLTEQKKSHSKHDQIAEYGNFPSETSRRLNLTRYNK